MGTTSVPKVVTYGLMCPGCPETTVEHMSTVQTAPPAAAKTPRARTTTESLTPTPSGSTAAEPDRRRSPMLKAVRNVGIALDTAARVVFLGRDGVKL